MKTTTAANCSNGKIEARMEMREKEKKVKTGGREFHHFDGN